MLICITRYLVYKHKILAIDRTSRRVEFIDYVNYLRINGRRRNWQGRIHHSVAGGHNLRNEFQLEITSTQNQWPQVTPLPCTAFNYTQKYRSRFTVYLLSKWPLQALKPNQRQPRWTTYWHWPYVAICQVQRQLDQVQPAARLPLVKYTDRLKDVYKHWNYSYTGLDWRGTIGLTANLLDYSLHSYTRFKYWI